MPAPHPLGSGRYTVPGNRWDLLSAGSDSATPPSAEVTPIPDVSVVIPFYDNQHDLDLVLTGLSLQSHPRSRLQIVIADDGSPEPPRIPDATRGLKIAVVSQDDAGFRAGAARNLGVRHAEGSVILFLDGDTVPTPDYVRALGRLPALLPDAVVSGRRRYADLSTWSPAELLAWFDHEHAAPEQWDELPWLTNEYERSGNLLATHPRSYKYQIGAVLGCSRELFDDIGGFDETITGYGGEDYDFTYRAYNAGAVLAYVPEAVAWHDGPDWAGRIDPGDETAQKNREVMMLAERIPETSMRGRGQRYPVADVVVTAHTPGWSLGAGVLCIRSLLTELDSSLWISDEATGSDSLRTSFRLDQRVVRTPFEDDSSKYLTDKARLQMQVYLPFRATAALTQLLTRMLDEDWGTLTVTTHGEKVLDVESTRSRRRRERWSSGEYVSFEDRVMDGTACGIHPISEEPRLAAEFGGYA